MRAEHLVKRFLIDKRNGRSENFSVPDAPTYHMPDPQLEGTTIDTEGRSMHIAG
jgi:hypothetical protein